MASTSQENTVNTYANAATPHILPQRHTYYLDLRANFTPFNIPETELVMASLRFVFQDDSSLMAYALCGRNQGIYQVMLKNKLDNPREYPVTFNINGEQEKVYLTPPIYGKNREMIEFW